MPRKNLHDEPFDVGTLAKLEIFEEYTKFWLPTFCNIQNRTVCIFDFFAGTGYDITNVPGSPIRIFQVVCSYVQLLITNKITVVVYLNELSQEKCNLLKEACESYLDEYPALRTVIKYRIDSKDFEVSFKELLPVIGKYPSLVFLDQNGVKFASDEYFQTFGKLSQTDFFYFISSSYIWRFGEKDEFKKYLGFDVNKLKENGYNFIHQEVVNALRNKLPVGSELKLYPFSIKKGTNIYGLVFGAKHPFAVEKFLNIAWKANKVNGDANFDINEDIIEPKRQLNLFPEPIKLTKIQKFQQRLQDRIKLAGEISNLDLYKFTLEQAHISTHAKEHLILLKKEKMIDFDCKYPKVNYEAFKKNDVLMIKWIAK